MKLIDLAVLQLEFRRELRLAMIEYEKEINKLLSEGEEQEWTITHLEANIEKL